jgi:hypothetical protein
MSQGRIVVDGMTIKPRRGAHGYQYQHRATKQGIAFATANVVVEELTFTLSGR